MRASLFLGVYRPLRSRPIEFDEYARFLVVREPLDELKPRLEYGALRLKDVEDVKPTFAVADLHAIKCRLRRGQHFTVSSAQPAELPRNLSARPAPQPVIRSVALARRPLRAQPWQRADAPQ